MDLSGAYHLAGVIGGIVTIAGLIVLVARSKDREEAAKASGVIAAEWKELATAKAAKITDLEARVNHLEEQLRAVRSENDEYRRLNMQYQREVVELRQKVADLERDVQDRARPVR